MVLSLSNAERRFLEFDFKNFIIIRLSLLPSSPPAATATDAAAAFHTFYPRDAIARVQVYLLNSYECIRTIASEFNSTNSFILVCAHP